ncbi:MAG: ABC transporter substrate-binding protein [Leptospirales bacterium]|nr:ABC transporter substrate-binding protein [Leptospirales bacterium]
MKKLVVVLFSLMLALFFACAKTSDTLKPGETIKLGFIAPMTGDSASYGKITSQAVIIAVDEFNEQGGINGFKVQLIIEDSAGNKDIGVPAAEKMIKSDKVLGLVGDVFSSVSLAVAPIAETAKVVMISPASTHKDFPDKGKFIFRDIINDAVQAIVFAKYLATVENLKKASVLYMNNDYSKGLANDFWSEFEKEGGEVVAVESAEEGTKDFKPQLKKIADKKPEALYVPNYVPDNALIIKQAKEIGLKVKIYSADSFGNTQIFDLLGDLANGVIFTQMAEHSESTVAKNFATKYETRWGEAPEAFSLNAYDAANIILNGIKLKSSKDVLSSGLNIDRDQLRDFIAATKDYDGVSGKITFTENGDLVGNIGIFLAEDKKFTQIKSYKLDGQNLVELK